MVRIKLSTAGHLVMLGSLIAVRSAFADVTVQEQMSLDVAIMKAHITETNYFSGDKKRSDTLFACDGFMKFLCGKQKGTGIERIDEGVIWHIDDKQRTYIESAMMSPEQLQTTLKQQQAAYDKLKSCPAVRSAGPDVSKCELSEPQIAITKTADHATLLGHDTQRTNISLSQSCKVRETGDDCELVYAFDLWLTQDDIAGMADRRAFEKAYLKKQGLSPQMIANPALTRALTPYADSLRKLNAKSADLQGLPLRTRFRFAYGGAHCQAVNGSDSNGGPSVVGNAGTNARGAAESSTAGAAGSMAAESAMRSAGSGPASYIAGSSAGAFASSLVGGMFAKHRASQTPAPAAPSDSLTTANGQTLHSIAEMTVETLSIDATPVAPALFEVPAGYKKLEPATTKVDETPSCPAS